ncbi:hypothetical protein [Phenylobacterium aquaticum]|uniref:hypothetical protein n=1 Tax=Phenylobacterium aquaticum TaxID=1763816 RepID=UPI001F5D5557|nr:hypothetical protein [Phenylobacterium aquaticum]MCI3132167.1 hypothetical protein [Phenylobacterium aquaticum]
MRAAAWVAIVLLALASKPALGAEGEPECFDVAAIARIDRNVATPLPENQRDAMIARWPWLAEISVEEVLLGSEGQRHLQTVQMQHVGFDPRYQHWLLLLKRSGDGTYSIVDDQPFVIRDLRGRFVIPLTNPWVLRPGWNSPDFVAAARPIQYRASDAWWLARWRKFDVEGEGAGWTILSNGHAVALRGLYVDDLVNLLRPRWAQLCGASGPGQIP